jgi:predicted transposase YdaD
MIFYGCVNKGISDYRVVKRLDNSLAFKHEKIKKEVTEVMGGQVLEYEAKNILNRGLRLGREEGRVEGRMEGRMEGIPNGENKLARLIKSLRADNRQDEIDKVLDDEVARQAMYKEYGITD